MADKGHEETEKLLKTLEGRVTREYKQAEKDVEAKLKDYLRRFKVKDAAKRKALERGEITQETYDKWRLGQIMIGKRWEEMRDTLAEDYLHAHEIAQGLAYDTAIDVYALNHNYGTFIAEKGALVDTSYTLYNHAAVERLIKERPNLLPDPSKDTLLKIKQGKIKRWSKQKITSAVTQGILQGEPLMDIAKRLRAVTNMDRAASIRNARTTVTNAQSAGRYDAFRRIKQMGLDPKVVWIATLDNHTRHEHRMLDGQMQEIDEPFEVEGKKILYPANTGFGDYKVPADLVYNCRCTIGVAYPGTKLYEEGLQGVDRFSRLGDMSYEEWKGIHEEAEKAGGGNSKQIHYRTFANGEEASKWFGQHPDRSLRKTDREEYERQKEEYQTVSMFGSWKNGLSYEEERSIGEYSSDAYHSINGLLRGEVTEKMTAAWDATVAIPTQEMIKHIERAIDSFVLEEPIRVYRTCENDVLEALSLSVGSVFHDDGFGSTSILSKKVASGNIVMQINVPKGKGYGAWINPLSGAMDEEYEFLLQRGSDFRVKAIRKEGDDTVVELDLLGSTKKEWSFATKEEVIELWKKKGIPYDEFTARDI